MTINPSEGGLSIFRCMHICKVVLTKALQQNWLASSWRLSSSSQYSSVGQFSDFYVLFLIFSNGEGTG